MYKLPCSFIAVQRKQDCDMLAEPKEHTMRLLAMELIRIPA